MTDTSVPPTGPLGGGSLGGGSGSGGGSSWDGGAGGSRSGGSGGGGGGGSSWDGGGDGGSRRLGGSGLGVLVLHGVRLKGVADGRVVAERFGLDEVVTTDLLLDYQACGWIGWSEFAGSGGWSLTDSGRAENERQLAAELDQVGGREEIHAVYQGFLPLNGRLQQACTDWQIRPTATDALAFNDHSEPDWDRRVVEELESLGQALLGIVKRASAVLERFRGYDSRFAAALAQVRAGDGSWVDRTGADSCHTVWFELHEDLIATLGLRRGAH